MKNRSSKTLGIIIGCLIIIGVVLCVVLAGLTMPTAKETPVNIHTDKKALQTTPSGLRFQILKVAPEGASKPKKGQQVYVQYTGWLNSDDQPGKKFDSSYDRNEPFTFIVGTNQVIKGWDESLLQMKVGEKRRVILPPELAYGSRAVANLIPANSSLLFDIELLEIGSN